MPPATAAARDRTWQSSAEPPYAIVSAADERTSGIWPRDEKCVARRGRACSRVTSDGAGGRRVSEQMEVAMNGGIGKVVERKV